MPTPENETNETNVTEDAAIITEIMTEEAPVKKSPVKKPAVKKSEVKKHYFFKSLHIKAQVLYDNHQGKILIMTGLVILALIGMYSIYIQQRFDHHLSRITEERILEEAVKMDDALKEKVQFTLTRKVDTKLAKMQVIVSKKDSFTTVFNAAEDTIPATYRTLFTSWAKEKGFDGIVFGRIQPLFNGGVKFASYSGKNAVPLDYVVEKLLLSGCNNAISMMANKTDFWLPHPFSYQINGDLKIYETSGLQVAGYFSILDKKIKITADNFEGTLDDGELTVKLKDHKPWEMPIPNHKKIK